MLKKYVVFTPDLDVTSCKWYNKVLGVFDTLAEAEEYHMKNSDYYEACGRHIYIGEELKENVSVELW